jgi:hypothetical protein
MPILQARLVNQRRGKLESDTEGPTKWLVFLIKSSVLWMNSFASFMSNHKEGREREIYIYTSIENHNNHILQIFKIPSMWDSMNRSNTKPGFPGSR